MYSSKFDSAFDKAMAIQQATEGEVLTPMGVVNQPTDNGYIADFNAGVDQMYLYTNKHITPRS